MNSDLDLIHSIYDLPLNPDGMPDVLQEICDRIGAFGAMVFDCATIGNTRRVGLQHLSLAYDRAATQAYIDMYNDHEIEDQDRFADLSSSGNEINLIHDQRLYSPDNPPGPNVLAMREYGVAARFGSLLSKESWNTDRFAFQFGEGAMLPDPAQVLWAEDMLSHLSKSISMGHVFARSKVLNVAVTKYLNTLNIGVAIVDKFGSLMFSNTETDRIVAQNLGVDITPQGRILFQGAEAFQTDVQRLLGGEITGVNGHGTCGARPRREALYVDTEGAQNGVFVEICPIADHPDLEHFGGGARLVTMLDSVQSYQLDAGVVARFFPLSKAEQAVLELLGQGHSNMEIADIRSRSIETVNSQIKSIFRKTNSRNRTELVKVSVGLSAVSQASKIDLSKG